MQPKGLCISGVNDYEGLLKRLNHMEWTGKNPYRMKWSAQSKAFRVHIVHYLRVEEYRLVVQLIFYFSVDLYIGPY